MLILPIIKMKDSVNKKALLAIHDKDLSSALEDSLRGRGSFDVTVANSVDQMLELMGLSQDSPPDAAPINHFDLYCMDTNLGSPTTLSYKPAEDIYRHVRDLVKRGEVQFVAITGKSNLVAAASGVGIPCYDKGDFERMDAALGI